MVHLDEFGYGKYQTRISGSYWLAVGIYMYVRSRQNTNHGSIRRTQYASEAYQMVRYRVYLINYSSPPYVVDDASCLWRVLQFCATIRAFEPVFAITAGARKLVQVVY